MYGDWPLASDVICKCMKTSLRFTMKYANVFETGFGYVMIYASACETGLMYSMKYVYGDWP